VYNASTSPRTVTVTAKLYSASGTLLKTVSAHPLQPTLGSRQRSAFLIATTRPTGFATVKYTVTSTAASKATRILPASGVTASSSTAGRWTVRGSILNNGTTTAKNVLALVTLYGDSAEILDATAIYPTSSTLGVGQSSPFSITFKNVLVTPMVSGAKGKAS
jgi:hypothetical protein